jgi:hypothetical protein
MQFMKIFVRVAGLYNASTVLVFLTPGALPLLGVRLPHSPFWVWLPALMGLFAGIVLFLSSQDLVKYGAFPYWNGIVRLIFVAAAFTLNFGGSAGAFIGLLAIGDVPLALGCMFGLPRVLNRSHRELLTNRLSSNGTTGYAPSIQT